MPRPVEHHHDHTGTHQGGGPTRGRPRCPSLGWLALNLRGHSSCRADRPLHSTDARGIRALQAEKALLGRVLGKASLTLPPIDLDRISRPYDPDRYRQPGEPRSSRKCDHGLEFLGSQAKLYHVELVAHRTAQLDRVQQSTTKIATTHDTPMGPTPARPESIAPGDRASPEALASPAT